MSRSSGDPRGGDTQGMPTSDEEVDLPPGFLYLDMLASSQYVCKYTGSAAELVTSLVQMVYSAHIRCLSARSDTGQAAHNTASPSFAQMLDLKDANVCSVHALRVTQDHTFKPCVLHLLCGPDR